MASNSAERVIDNPRSRERIIIRARTPELLVFDTVLEPGAHVPARHAHPNQEERFTVAEGEVRFRVGKRTIVLYQGESVVVPPGTTHWFGNVGHGQAELRVEVRPALRTEELLATSSGEGGLLNWALIPVDFRPELLIPHLPVWVLTPLAWLRRAVLLPIPLWPLLQRKLARCCANSR